MEKRKVGGRVQRVLPAVLGDWHGTCALSLLASLLHLQGGFCWPLFYKSYRVINAIELSSLQLRGQLLTREVSGTREVFLEDVLAKLKVEGSVGISQTKEDKGMIQSEAPACVKARTWPKRTRLMQDAWGTQVRCVCLSTRHYGRRPEKHIGTHSECFLRLGRLTQVCLFIFQFKLKMTPLTIHLTASFFIVTGKRGIYQSKREAHLHKITYYVK